MIHIRNVINKLNLVWKDCLGILHNRCCLSVSVTVRFARDINYFIYKLILIREQIVRFCNTIGLPLLYIRL